MFTLGKDAKMALFVYLFHGLGGLLTKVWLVSPLFALPNLWYYQLKRKIIDLELFYQNNWFVYQIIAAWKWTQMSRTSKCFMHVALLGDKIETACVVHTRTPTLLISAALPLAMLSLVPPLFLVTELENISGSCCSKFIRNAWPCNCMRPSYYRTQVYLGSDLCVQVSLRHAFET